MNGKGWHGENKRHRDVQAKGALESTLRAPLQKRIYYVGRQEGKPQGKYIYLSESEEYAKNFGENIFKYNIEPKKTLDMTPLKENSISFNKIKSFFKANGITSIDASLVEEYDESYKPAWMWIRKYPVFVDKIKDAGFDSIKQLETYLGTGRPTTTVQVLDNTILQEV